MSSSATVLERVDVCIARVACAVRAISFLVLVFAFALPLAFHERVDLHPVVIIRTRSELSMHLWVQLHSRTLAAKKQAVENGVNGTLVATATRVDDPGQTPKEDRAKHTISAKIITDLTWCRFNFFELI